MTEEEWLSSTDPQMMQEFLSGKASDRKWHRFAVACYQRVSHLAIDERPRRASQRERRAQTDSLRCIFGNPFRPVTLDPAWLTATVKQLAEAIYEERAFDRMPILGDALEESGCSNGDILSHCRQPGQHCRGCWVVDLLLGKS